MKDYKSEISVYLDKVGHEENLKIMKFHNKLRDSKYVCIFGAGGLGKTMAQNFMENDIKVDFFCDNNKELFGKEIISNIKCISINKLEQYKNDLIIIVATTYYKEILAQLNEAGFNNFYLLSERRLKFDESLARFDLIELKLKLFGVIDILEDENSKSIFSELIKNWFKPFSEYPYNYDDIKTGSQYFSEDIITLSDNEVFVDAGAFDGDTIMDFLSKTDNNFDKIFAFELDKNNYNKLVDNVKNMTDDIKNKIVLNNIGVYDENKDIKYGSNLTSSVINENALEVGRITRLSDNLENEKVTFIKMDIEGSEFKALIGAEEIIKKQKPKLAICIYHEASHFWEIPLYIKSLVPEYKIFIRHHTNLEYETVCYAVL